MERTFTKYVSLPLGEEALKAQGWHKHVKNGCNPQLGFAWTEESTGSTKSHPMKLYTTAAGQPSGVGIAIRGINGNPLPEPQRQWATTKPLVSPSEDPAVAHIDVAFRSGDIICSGETSTATIGDTLIVNPTGNSSKSIPLTEDAIKADGWRRGSCFDGMGFHWFLDTSLGAGQLSWKAENLFPVVAMTHEGSINAIFFATTFNQVSIPLLMSNEWEPLALSNDQMCKNTCDDDCTFSGMPAKGGPWSTAHVYFRDHKSVTCASELTCGFTWPFRGNCCDKKELNTTVLV